MDTIFAESTAPGRAGVSVIRVSGLDVPEVMREICGRVLVARRAEICDILDAAGNVIDRGVCIFFAAPRSFTGEDVLEFQVHGSVAVVQSLMDRLAEFDGCRHAEAGEFTRRALTHGKMDLIEVEGLSDLIDAETEEQRRLAQASMSGQFRAFVDELRNDLVRAAALLEATIDFADEEVPEDVSTEVLGLLDSAERQLDAQLDGFRFAEQVRKGFEVAIVGAPNVGKSTLLNALAGREAAITSSVAGTTRDVIEVRMNLDGVAVTLLDTAGLRETEDQIESIGVDRAVARAEAADLRVFLREGGEQFAVSFHDGDILRLAKADMLEDKRSAVSGLTGLGLDALVEELANELKRRVGKAGLASHVRQKQAMESAVASINMAKSEVAQGIDRYEFGAEEIRTGVRRLDALIGRVDVENLLDVIFSSFCVGK